MAQSIYNEDSTIYSMTNGEYHSLRYDAAGDNYSGPLVQQIIQHISKAGVDVTNTRVDTVGTVFRDIVLAYQEKFDLPRTGIVDDELLRDIYKRSNQTASSEITDDDYEYDTENAINELPESDVYDAHYDPFFLNNSSKVYRKNHKDIVISLGNGANTKVIKDVFMRSVSVQVDTSGNPISETYNFIARDIKESDASEDNLKYIGEEKNLTASSDIKYSYDTLFKDY